ncbi:MAG: S-layer protein, partial [Planctomycetota bacterium]
MVNMKKIGAIATGALFIGATFGMASAAVTVPSGIASKLASGGVAKADLVVGADAPGATADTESAKEIQDAVKAKLAATVGGDISIEFGANELHDASSLTNYVNKSTLSSLFPTDAKVYSIPGSEATNMNNESNATLNLRFDQNADGDLKD